MAYSCNEDSYPPLGSSVYRKGSGSRYAKQGSKNVGSNTVNSANCIEIANEGSGFKNSAQGVWGTSNVLAKLGFGVQISGNGRTIQKADSKNVPSCKSESSSEENCKIKQEGIVPPTEVVLPQLNGGEEGEAKDKLSNGKLGTPEVGLPQLNGGEGEEVKDELLLVNSDDGDSDLGTSKKSHETEFPFFSGGKCQLCGHMASKEDMESFNQHSHGNSGRTCQESQELVKVKEEQKLLQVLSDSVRSLGQELRSSVETNSILREQFKLLLESIKEELNCQEQFSLYQIRKIHQAIDAKGDDFEKVQQAKTEEVEQSNANLSNCTHR